MLSFQLSTFFHYNFVKVKLSKLPLWLSKFCRINSNVTSISFQTPNLEGKNLNKSVASVLFLKKNFTRQKLVTKHLCALLCSAAHCLYIVHTYMHAGRRRYAGAAIKSPPSSWRRVRKSPSCPLWQSKSAAQCNIFRKLS